MSMIKKLPNGFDIYRERMSFGDCYGYRRLKEGVVRHGFDVLPPESYEYLFRLPATDTYLTGPELSQWVADHWVPVGYEAESRFDEAVYTFTHLSVPAEVL